MKDFSLNRKWGSILIPLRSNRAPPFTSPVIWRPARASPPCPNFPVQGGRGGGGSICSDQDKSWPIFLGKSYGLHFGSHQSSLTSLIRQVLVYLFLTYPAWQLLGRRSLPATSAPPTNLDKSRLDCGLIKLGWFCWNMDCHCWEYTRWNVRYGIKHRSNSGITDKWWNMKMTWDCKQNSPRF